LKLKLSGYVKGDGEVKKRHNVHIAVTSSTTATTDTSATAATPTTTEHCY